MSYNLKCCSFYPNNFDASALTPTEIHAYPDRGTMTNRFFSEYMLLNFNKFRR